MSGCAELARKKHTQNSDNDRVLFACSVTRAEVTKLQQQLLCNGETEGSVTEAELKQAGCEVGFEQNGRFVSVGRVALPGGRQAAATTAAAGFSGPVWTCLQPD